MSIPQPIFILASSRSFTSIVCAMLGQHPQAYGVPEINLFTRDTMAEFVQSSQKQKQFKIHGLWRTVAQLYTGEQTMHSVEMARRWVHRRKHLTTGEVYQELCGKVAPLRIVDKSPAYAESSQAMARIATTFPDARYLYMSRHPKDQGKSVLKSPQGLASLFVAHSFDITTNPPTIDPQYFWYKTQVNILEFLDTIPSQQQMRLRGEDLLNNPRAYLEQICHWLDLDWDEEIYQIMLRTEDSPYACMGPFNAQWGNNPGFQKSPQFRYRPIQVTTSQGDLPWRKDYKGFEPPVMEMLVSLGYE